MTRDYRDESVRQQRKMEARRSTAKVVPSYAVLPATLRAGIAEATSDPDFVAITLFCAIGLLATMNLILRIPDIGMM
jgi:hypothetical protein